jgi:hypothetical protein
MCAFVLTFGFQITLVFSHGGAAGVDTLPIAHTLQNTHSTPIPIAVITSKRWDPEYTADYITHCAAQKWFHDGQLVHNAPRNCPGMRNAVCPIADEILQCRVTMILNYFNVTIYQGPSEGRKVRWRCREAVGENIWDAERVKAMKRRI